MVLILDDMHIIQKLVYDKQTGMLSVNVSTNFKLIIVNTQVVSALIMEKIDFNYSQSVNCYLKHVLPQQRYTFCFKFRNTILLL